MVVKIVQEYNFYTCLSLSTSRIKYLFSYYFFCDITIYFWLIHCFYIDLLFCIDLLFINKRNLNCLPLLIKLKWKYFLWILTSLFMVWLMNRFFSVNIGNFIVFYDTCLTFPTLCFIISCLKNLYRLTFLNCLRPSRIFLSV